MTESSRETPFPERVRTRIWEELPQPGNAFLARGARCHGYAHEALVRGVAPVEALYLLLRGELPAPHARRLLERFLVAFCNPGPRHAATRAVMNAAASGTRNAALPAIGMALLGGADLGSAEVDAAARFIARHRGRDPAALATERIAAREDAAEPRADRRVAPGFGTLAGDIDPCAAALAAPLLELAGADGPLAWAARFADALASAGCGWLLPGVAAATTLELGFAPRAAGLLFQYAALPGLIAHALEVAGRGPAAMPFVPDSRYELLDAPETRP